MPEMLGLKYDLDGLNGWWIRDCGTNADPHPSGVRVKATAVDIAPCTSFPIASLLLCSPYQRHGGDIVTKQTRTKTNRKKLGIPPKRKVAAIRIDRKNNFVMVATNNIIQNMLHRDGPKVRRSFDVITRTHVAECSALLGDTVGMMMLHLPKIDDDGYKATVSRLLSTAVNTYLASIETARHGFRRQYGVLARTLIELIATVIVIGTDPDALERFHAGELPSTKCVGWAKAVLEPIGMYYGMLSSQFAHIGPVHAILESPKPYSRDDEALKFVIATMRSNIWLLYLATELSYHDELNECRYWKAIGRGVAYNPDEKERAWMSSFLINPYEDEQL